MKALLYQVDTKTKYLVYHWGIQPLSTEYGIPYRRYSNELQEVPPPYRGVRTGIISSIYLTLIDTRKYFFMKKFRDL